MLRASGRALCIPQLVVRAGAVPKRAELYVVSIHGDRSIVARILSIPNYAHSLANTPLLLEMVSLVQRTKKT